MNNNCWQCRK